ncbi:preprotein translocase subunit YidC [Geotalea daltonii FRC-32]|uniref:Membrane protein insertase YidC n=1 Tax=Geotalea daltonii (strain DSM 22248 / JCM 15807 / FRC-32) TaxID=316067 RepID=YIDC_GEODF|nr:membrane protein insertase YidC [Geotalea daltonii]B9M7R9.1 RecName: Full=Membrane protein insertase YidC; AltName: Full=Foldase YidC; AltName: Full=Membrane integrase YidC; AltName: Full=Membrane protein YidC [Geotalea daltonii FRC-32]ACM22175.1 preprotein translocase subunit YidC [Geotalea daltonii FRC-32]
MEKRVVIAVILSIVVLYAFSYMFPPPVANQKEKAGPVAAVQSQPSSAKLSAIDSVPAAATPQAGLAARNIVVDTDLFIAVFSTKGGGLQSFQLKHYKDKAGAVGRDIVLKNESDGDKLSLLSEGKSFGLEPSLVFQSSAKDTKLAGTEKSSIEFTVTSQTGVILKKVYSFSGNGYGINLHQELINTGSSRVEGAISLINYNRLVAETGDGRYEVYGPVTMAGDKVITDKVSDIAKGPKQFDNNVSWSAFADKYFMDAVIAVKNSIASARVAKISDNYVQTNVTSSPLSLNPGQSASMDYRLFYGPKDLDILKAQGSRLEEAIDFGWFSALAKPLLRSIKFFYSYTHNYGLAIIIITIILKVLFFPLTHKSYKSMKEMQKLQPKMVELKEKFKNDRDAMNRAVMDLYKTHKVNPMGGCLPMLVQIPVFFALYKALMFSIELRHAPFVLWITDLSAKDPYYVTPIIMGVTMFIQQKMTPTNMDPIQAKMMLALPVVFTFMFLNFPAGLVLYWLINNILTIAQQAYINKSLPA